MLIKIRFRRVNPEYSQEYADFHNGGKECMQNPKFDWVYESKVDNIESISLDPIQDYPVFFENDSGDQKEFTFSNMCVFNCFGEGHGPLFTWAISRSALAVMPEKRPLRNFTNHNKNTITQYFDVRPDVELVEIRPGLYVSIEEVPSELISQL
jgi:hypothetical protein